MESVDSEVFNFYIERWLIEHYNGGMILYVDETENNDFFIVSGLLVDSEESTKLAYKQFKKSIKGFKISEKAKSNLYTEFKSTIMDARYQRIKMKMLERISTIPDAKIIYSCYRKKINPLNQVLKESVYITLLSSIVSAINEQADIIFDRFGIDDFEESIAKSVVGGNIESVTPQDSQKVEGLQFVDNVCSTIRLYRSGNDSHDFYSTIKNIVIEV